MDAGKPMRRPPSARKGFTLVELSIAIAIIAILAALLLPALAKAKGTAQRAVCASHLRQLHLAAPAYVGETTGSFPPRESATRWPG